MKRSILRKGLSGLIAGITILSLTIVISVPVSIHAATQSIYYVDPISGNDNNDGLSETAAFQTITHARDIVRTVNSNMTGDIIVYLRGGTYPVNNTIIFTAGDSGTNGYQVKYTAYNGETPIISGGESVTGWTLVDSTKNIYRAYIGNNNFRQLYVAGQKATRARTPNAGNYYKTSALPDTTNKELIVPSDAISNWNNFSKIEMVLLTQWSENYLRLSSYHIDSSNAHVIVQTEEKNIIFSRNYPWLEDNQSFYLENAYEFIDQESEWYCDTDNQYLYYKPRSGENMATVDVVIPKVETLFNLEASSYDNPIHNISFYGLTFSHSNWLYASNHGKVGLQGGMYIDSNGQTVRPPAAVNLHGTTNVKFERNTFHFLGSTGIDMNSGTNSTSVCGNVFKEISGSAIMDAVISSAIYNPTDPRDKSLYDNINNNYISKIGQDYYGCPAISCGYATSISITHNEIDNVPYSGIAVGWGWTTATNAMNGTYIAYNRITNFMNVLYDGGAIYTLSNQGGSPTIERNYIQSNFTGLGYGYSAIHLDQGSSNFIVQNNVVDIPTNYIYWVNSNTGTTATVCNNFSNSSKSNIKSSSVVLSNNTFITNNSWPAESLTIINESGLETMYCDLRSGSPIPLEGASATASSEQSGYPASNSIDCFNGSRWRSAANQKEGDFFTVDLGKARDIGKIKLNSDQNAVNVNMNYNFDDGLRSSLFGSNYTIVDESGNKVLQHTATPSFGVLIAGTQDIGNFYLSTKIRSGTGGAVVFSFRQQGDTQSNLGNISYRLELRDSTLKFSRATGTTGTLQHNPDFVTMSGNILGDRDWHSLVVKMYGSRMQIIFDGVDIVSSGTVLPSALVNGVITDETYITGDLMMASVNSQASIDDFVLQSLTADPFISSPVNINYSFDDNIRNDLAGSNFSIATENGNNILKHTSSPTWAVLKVGTQEIGNFAMKTRIRSGTAGATVFSFRQQGYDQSNLGNICYRLELRDSYLKLSKATSSSALYNPVFVTTSVGMGDRGWHTLEVSMLKNQILIKFDGTDITLSPSTVNSGALINGIITDDTYSTGYLQIASVNSQLSLDNFTIYNISSETNNYPTDFEIYTSEDNVSWGTPILSVSNNSKDLIDECFSSIKARYIKIVVISTKLTKWSIYDFKVYYGDRVDIPRENWTASAIASVSGFPPCNAFDNSASTRWCSGKSQAAGDWFLIDMGNSYFVSGLFLSNNVATNFPNNFSIYITDDTSNWEPEVTSVTNNSDDVINVTFTPKQGRYVKIVLNSGKGAYWSINDIHWYG